MSRQQFPSEQGTAPFWIHVQSADGQVVDVNQAEEEYYDLFQYLPLPQPPSPHGAGLGVGYLQDDQYYLQFPNVNLASVTNYLPPPQTSHRPLVIPPLPPPSSSPILIPNSRGPSAESSPVPSLSTSASTSSSSSVNTAGSDVCRQAQSHFNEETQQWSCGGCNKTFSDKYGAERHIATVGLKVTCRYCGSRVSALEFSRRRHFQRESCRRQGIQQGFTTRNEEEAFLEDH